MLARIKLHQEQIYSVLIGLFFILIFHVKLSYSLIPLMLTLSGMAILMPQFKNKPWRLATEDKWLIVTCVFYFSLFVLSLIIHQGEIRELDLPSRALLVLPILAVIYHYRIKQVWILYAILFASFVAGTISAIQIFGLGLDKPFPNMMHIQAGGIAMSFAVFCLSMLFYFYTQKQRVLMIISLLAALFALSASFLTGARGGWLGAPIVIGIIFFLNRRILSKWIIAGVLLIALAGAVFTSHILHQRYLDAQNDITAYITQSNTSTSIGARFDMWKSAALGIQEKPFFGWGLEGVKAMRAKHYREGKISQYAASFVHAHNQYLHDASVRGIFGLIALLTIFFVPLTIFLRNLKSVGAGSLSHLWSVLGITHVLMMMSYCLSQSFFSHNSGMLFYFVTTIIFLGLQRTAKNQPLTENNP